MQSLLPQDANVLFNAMFLRRLPEAMCTALADRGEMLPSELAAAADLLQHTAPLPVAALAPAVPAPAMPPVLLGPTVSAVQPSRRSTSPSPSRFRRRPATLHNHSAIYTKYKNLCTKMTSTLQRRHVHVIFVM